MRHARLANVGGRAESGRLSWRWELTAAAGVNGFDKIEL